MATLHGSIIGVHSHRSRPDYNGSGAQVMSCFVDVMWTGTYVQADNVDVLSVDAAIQASLRDGKTVTLLDAAFAYPGDEAGTVIGAKTVAVSTSDITAELTGSDLTTEHTGAALGTMAASIGLFVSFKLT